MTNLYQASIQHNPPQIPSQKGSGGVGSWHPGAIGSNPNSTIRYINIVTDSFQNASAIARAQCGQHEVVIGVSMMSDEVIVDSAVIQGDSA